MKILFFLRTLFVLSEGVFGQQYFRVKPHDTSVVVGKTAELHCHIGNQAGLVQWSKDGFLLGFDPEIPGYQRYEMRVDSAESAYTLLVHDARLDDEAEFQCQVGPGKNENPIRSVARLTVLVPPKLLSINDLPNGSEIQVPETEKVVLQCQAHSSKPATILKWFWKNIELMPDASRTTVRREGEKLYSTISSITLYPKGDTSGSTYTCEASHPAIEKPMKTTVRVAVLYPPQNPQIIGYREGNVYRGDHLTLTCSSAGGKPPAVVEWYRNDEMVEGIYTVVGRESRNSLSFAARERDNNAVYRCEASNPLTIKPLVASVKLSVMYPPSKVWVTGPKEAFYDEQITLSCRTDISNPPAELSWVVDGVPQDQESAAHPLPHGYIVTSNLTTKLSKKDKALKSFTCLAQTDLSHEKVFHTFNVSVLYPPEAPSIEGYEEGLELREGERKTFKCSSLTGNPPATLRWFRGDNEVYGVTGITGGYISSIISFEIEASDNEILVRCEVNSSLLVETLSTSVKLNVLFPPQNVSITVDPPQPREGDTVRFECLSGSSNPAAHVFWWKGTTLISENTHVETSYASYGGSSTRSFLNIPVTSSEDGVQFKCEAKNDAFIESIQESVVLHVFYAPVFITRDILLELVEGQSESVNMTAKAHPVVHSYRWTKEGQLVSETRDKSLSIRAEGPILYISHVSRYDNGVYTCIAQNFEGSAKARLTLNVLYPATIVNISSPIEIEEGNAVRMQCLVDAKPITKDTILWRKSGKSEGFTATLSSELNLSVLVLANVSKEDAGIYECIADNRIGSPSKKTTQLVVYSSPYPPKSLEFSNISQQAAVLSWTPGFDGGFNQSFKLRIRKTQDNSITFVHIPLNLTTYTLTGLSKGTTYEVSIAAKNVKGESNYTKPILLRTKSLPVMDSTVSGPIVGDNSSEEFLPTWLSTVAIIGGIVVATNILVCIICIQRKHLCRNIQEGDGSLSGDDELSQEKITKMIPSEDHSPFYLTGASVDIPDDPMDAESLQKSPGLKLCQVSTNSCDSLGRCTYEGHQWSNDCSTFMCGSRTSGDSKYGLYPDILNCHSQSSTTSGIVSEPLQHIESIKKVRREPECFEILNV